MHVDEAVLAPLRERFGEPATLEWEGEISEREHALATYNPRRMHDVTLFIFNGDRLALIRKHAFEPGIWRPPGGGVKEGEDFVAGVRREALEETGLQVELERYLVAATARFVYESQDVPWRTHVFLATTADRDLAPEDTGEIEAARWGTLPELHEVIALAQRGLITPHIQEFPLDQGVQAYQLMEKGQLSGRAVVVP